MTVSEQARADAWADAETLAINLNIPPNCPGIYVPWACGMVAGSAIAEGHVELSGKYAKYAAEAAFRAVPALRS